MAYETGVASTLTDLIGSVKTFAAANGFTLGPTVTKVISGPSNFNGEVEIHSLVKNGIYFLFAEPTTGNSYLYLNTATGHNGSDFTGLVPTWARSSFMTGPFLSHSFFCDSKAMHVAIELGVGLYTHFSFGEMTKNGSWSGGAYIDSGIAFGTSVSGGFTYGTVGQGSWQHLSPPMFGYTDIGTTVTYSVNARGHVRIPIGGLWAYIGSPHNTLPASNHVFSTHLARNHSRPLLDRCPNAFNGRSVLAPIGFVLSSTLTGGPYYNLGYLENAAAVNIQNFEPKETILTDWVVFPMWQKNGDGRTFPGSGNYGFAFKK